MSCLGELRAILLPLLLLLSLSKFDISVCGNFKVKVILLLFCYLRGESAYFVFSCRHTACLILYSIVKPSKLRKSSKVIFEYEILWICAATNQAENVKK